MGQQPTPTNGLANVINGIISAALSGGEVAVEAYVIALDPEIFAIPVAGTILKDILDQIVKAIGNAIYPNIAKFADAITIDIQTNGEESEVVQAAQALSAAQTSGDLNAVASSTQNLIAAYGSLIHSDGAATNANTP